MRILLVILCLSISSVSFAKGKGGFSFGGMLGLASTGGQTDINAMIGDANTGADGPISTGELTSGMEYIAHASYRFSGSMVEWQFRPSYFTASSTGTGTGGVDYNYEASGFTMFSVWRFVILESKIFKFFGNTGLGWAFVDGNVQENAYNVKFKGNGMGVLGGLGAEFCFTASHCMVVEGNVRYLPIQRTIVKSSSAASSGNHSSPANGEYEYNNSDVGISLSGIVGTLGYTFRF